MATSDNKTADTAEKIFIGKGEQTGWLSLALANRHGLVTGATGFIGRHLCRHLADRGHRLRVLVRPTTSAARRARLGEVEVITGDVTVPDSLPAAVDGCDAVVHLAGVIAATRRGIYDRVNTEGTRYVAPACAGRSCLSLERTRRWWRR